MTEKEQKFAAKVFAAYWKDKGYEKGESQAFWLSLLRDVYGIDHPEQFISFEDQVKLDHTSFIDGYIEATHVMIEQKGLAKICGKASSSRTALCCRHSNRQSVMPPSCRIPSAYVG